MTRQKNKALPEKTGDVNGSPDITRLFLSEGMGIEEEISAVYNLPAEFAASRNNRSYPVYAAIISFTAILLCATFWFTCGIQREIDRISVGIADFKDLNLAELLASLKRAELELQNVDEKIALSQQAMTLEMEKIRRNAEAEIKKVEESSIGQAEKNRIIKSIRDENDKKKKEIEKNYDDRIKENQKKAEDARNNMETLKKQIAGEKKEYEKNMNIRVQSYREESDSRIEEQKREYQALLASYEKELNSSRTETAKENEKKKDTEQLLGLYKRALIYYARTRGEHGYVIDPGTDGYMLVDVNPYITIHKGDHAYVLNRDSKVLALVELYPEGIRLKAKVLKRMMNDDIQPFDKILLKKN